MGFVAARKKYDWAGWFASRRFALRRGRDYSCSTASLVQQGRNAFAAWPGRRGLTLLFVRDQDGEGVVGLVLPSRGGDSRRWNSRRGTVQDAVVVERA